MFILLIKKNLSSKPDKANFLMNVGSTKEKNPEKRISITPDTSKNLKDLGLKVFLEKGYGESLGYSDDEYKNKGV